MGSDWPPTAGPQDPAQWIILKDDKAYIVTPSQVAEAHAHIDREIAAMMTQLRNDLMRGTPEAAPRDGGGRDGE